MIGASHRPDAWRKGLYRADGKHGPWLTRIVTGQTLVRAWTHCLDCGTRLESGLLHGTEEKGATHK